MSGAAVRAPGRGAAHMARPQGRYVYLVRSCRTGRPSIGIDLTPGGACPFACDYCQVPRAVRAATPDPIDESRLGQELHSALEQFGFLAADVAFAGSGEPTWSPQFAGALGIARRLATQRPRQIPVRVLTSGVTLGRADVASALADLVRSGDGEVWVKLDGWDEPSFRRAACVRGYVEHELRVLRFARTTPIVLQTMLVHRRDGPPIDEAATGLAAAVERLVSAGGAIRRVVLSTLFRPPGDPTVALAPFDDVELAQVADAIAATGVDVALPHA